MDMIMVTSVQKRILPMHKKVIGSVTMLAAGTEKAVGTPLMLVTCC